MEINKIFSTEAKVKFSLDFMVSNKKSVLEFDFKRTEYWI